MQNDNIPTPSAETVEAAAVPDAGWDVSLAPGVHRAPDFAESTIEARPRQHLYGDDSLIGFGAAPWPRSDIASVGDYNAEELRPQGTHDLPPLATVLLTAQGPIHSQPGPSTWAARASVLQHQSDTARLAAELLQTEIVGTDSYYTALHDALNTPGFMAHELATAAVQGIIDQQDDGRKQAPGSKYAREFLRERKSAAAREEVFGASAPMPEPHGFASAIAAQASSTPSFAPNQSQSHNSPASLADRWSNFGRDTSIAIAASAAAGAVISGPPGAAAAASAAAVGHAPALAGLLWDTGAEAISHAFGAPFDPSPPTYKDPNVYVHVPDSHGGSVRHPVGPGPRGSADPDALADAAFTNSLGAFASFDAQRAAGDGAYSVTGVGATDWPDQSFGAEPDAFGAE